VAFASAAAAHRCIDTRSTCVQQDLFVHSARLAYFSFRRFPAGAVAAYPGKPGIIGRLIRRHAIRTGLRCHQSASAPPGAGDRRSGTAYSGRSPPGRLPSAGRLTGAHPLGHTVRGPRRRPRTPQPEQSVEGDSRPASFPDRCEHERLRPAAPTAEREQRATDPNVAPRRGGDRTSDAEGRPGGSSAAARGSGTPPAPRRSQPGCRVRPAACITARLVISKAATPAASRHQQDRCTEGRLSASMRLHPPASGGPAGTGARTGATGGAQTIAPTRREAAAPPNSR